EHLRIMGIALVDPVEKRQMREPVSQEGQPDLAEMVPTGLVVTAYSDDSGHPFQTKAATCRSEATLGSHYVP
ncbi:MAG: hypothetical protein GQ555_00275, partial [Desulfobacterales bacterium]|nr:hypothetical protein [Desulfobacterales bacterium]